jgi:NACHT domain
MSFVQKIERLRGALMLAAILALRSSEGGHSDEIITHLRALQKTGDTHSTSSEKSNQKIQRILDIIESQSGSKSDLIQDQINRRLDEITLWHQSINPNREQTILKWLNFRQMVWRYEEVPMAYQETFQWIFRPPSQNDSWDDFGDYLARHRVDTPYFINGKAGSGKSTLLRFIVDNERTYEKLAHWAPPDQLLVLHFFFWNLGTPLQKSQTGMLRAILHKALSKHPELIPGTLPRIYSNWEDSYVGDQPSFNEMKRAFELFLLKASKFLKICIFIDGIDELDGDHRDLAQFTRSLAGENVKLVVSSRPINASVYVFRDCPTLKLQDLTRHDMAQYIKGNLVLHQIMTQMAKHDPRAAEQIITEIEEKADGVFLWVRLVVRLLVDGLEAGDSVTDLQKKLRSLPQDLKDLYRRMLSKILPEYQVQASEILQLFHIWNIYTLYQPLSLITLAFAMQSPSEAFRRTVAPIDLETYSWLCNTAEARIQSRCCGLLEAGRERGPANVILDWASGEINDGSVVRYLHRTVAEFLVSGDVWDETCRMTATSGFKPALNLSSACLSMIKSASPITRASEIKTLLVNMTTFLRSATYLKIQILCDYMNDIERSMTNNQNLPNWSSQTLSTFNGHWLFKFFQPRIGPDFARALEGSLEGEGQLNLAARTGFIQYLSATRDSQVRRLVPESTMLLYLALQSWLDKPQLISLQDRTDTIKYLLLIACPREYNLAFELWNSALVIGGQLLASGAAVDCAELLRSFILTVHNKSILTSGTNVEKGLRLLSDLQQERKLLADELRRLLYEPFGSDVSSQYIVEISEELGVVSHKAGKFERLVPPGAPITLRPITPSPPSSPPLRSSQPQVH